jgi:anti-anti-sigma regulatory factor
MREAVRRAPTTTHWLVLDAEGISHVETTGLQALGLLLAGVHPKNLMPAAAAGGEARTTRTIDH